MQYIRECVRGGSPILVYEEATGGGYSTRIENVERVIDTGNGRFEVYLKGGARVVLWSTVDNRPCLTCGQAKGEGGLPEYCFDCGQYIRGSKC